MRENMWNNWVDQLHDNSRLNNYNYILLRKMAAEIMRCMYYLEKLQNVVDG